MGPQSSVWTEVEWQWYPSFYMYFFVVELKQYWLYTFLYASGKMNDGFSFKKNLRTQVIHVNKEQIFVL